ncbi:MAG: DUF4861 family protein, partial [Candidatus Marinimicrobia bacterium]|nr:DUF4861 family protein [Candidatus Neomarinimicrobiota bacterium]
IIKPIIPLILMFTLLNKCEENKIYCNYPKISSILLKNPIPVKRIDSPVIPRLKSIKSKYPHFNEQNFILLDGKEEIPNKIIDTDIDNLLDVLLM